MTDPRRLARPDSSPMPASTPESSGARHPRLGAGGSNRGSIGRRTLTVAILGSSGGWHARRLADALAARGHEAHFLPVTRMLGHIDGDVAVRSRELWLDGCDAVIVRGIPRGSLEQVIFRVDALHALEARGVTCVNGPRAIERTINKFLASGLLARAGVPTPRTIACERREDALEAFAQLGGDVIVKPLFGSMGAGMTRIDDPDVAYRVFGALELERAVYYLQEALPAGRDLRAFVVGGRVLAAIERVGAGWRANLARGARAQAAELSADQERLCVAAAEALGADYAGVDLLDHHVLELNGIPGWHGLQEATGADVAGALVAHVEALVNEAPPAR
jgi:RimK family alpha-L-glutamate ligase